MWVEREINLFLQNHTQDQILTVLADGEPADVIPEVLKNKEVTRVKENGETETVIEPVEPLSCDFRLPKRDAINIELPRLAAALIGCSYSELINRQRQYKMRRLTAVFAGIIALSLSFGVYMYHSKKVINENYRQALMSRSRYLANESLNKFSDSDRILAVQLALEALPDENNPDKPVVPEAVQAITQSTLAYNTRSSTNINAEWSYSVSDNMITNFDVSQDRSSIAAIDQEHNIKVWNTETHKETFSNSDHIFNNIGYIDENLLLLMGDSNLQIVNGTTGETMCETTAPENDSFISGKYAYTSDSILIPLSSGWICKFSIKTLEIEETYNNALISSIQQYDSIDYIAIAPSYEKFAYVSHSDTEKANTLTVCNLKTKTAAKLTLDSNVSITDLDTTKELYWIDDKNLCLVENTASSNVNTTNTQLLSTDHNTILCINADDLSVKWTQDFPYTTASYYNRIFAIPDTDTLGACDGNFYRIYDKETGKELHSYNTNSPIITIRIPNEKIHLGALTIDGEFSSPDDDSEKDTHNQFKDFPDNIERCIIAGGIYTQIKGSNEVVFFTVGLYDHNETVIEDSPSVRSISIYSRCYNDAITTKHEENGLIYLSYFDPVSKKLLGKTELGALDSYAYKDLGCYNGKIYISYSEETNNILEIDINTGKTKEHIVPPQSDFIKSNDCIGFDKGFIVYKTKLDNEYVLATKNLESGEEQHYPLPTLSSFSKVFYDHDSGVIYLVGYDNGYILNVEKKELNEITFPEDWGTTSMVSILPSEKKIAVSNKSKILVMDYSGKVLYEIACPSLAPFTASVYVPENAVEKKILLVPYEQGNLYRYDVETGEYLGQSEFSVSSSVASFTDMSFYYDNKNSLLYIQDNSLLLSIIETRKWLELTCIYPCIGYNKESDTFITSSKNDELKDSLAYFKRYTLEELIQRGKEQVGDISMSEENKAKYGID